MSDSLQPHGLQATRLPRPWKSPGKNTGVDCHFLLHLFHYRFLQDIEYSSCSIQWVLVVYFLYSSLHLLIQNLSLP